jgi:hypothetical protein
MRTDAQLLRLLGLGLIRLAVKPDSNENQPASGRNANAGDPRVGTADDETARPLIVSKVAERTLVVDNEVEDTMLIGHGEAGLEDSAIGSWLDCVQSHTVEGRQHAELELERISGSRKEGDPTVTIVLGHFNREMLYLCQRKTVKVIRRNTYDIVLDSVHDRVDLGELGDGQVGGFLDLALVEVVLDLTNLEYTNLLESPGRQLFGKGLVGGSGGLGSAGSLDLSIEPSILQHLGRTEDSEAG